LGIFITVDNDSLKSSSRKVARILTEMDIHGGFSEVIDIEWRGRHLRQNLDYLGLLFRCSSCRGTGHLRWECKGAPLEEESEESMLLRDPPEYMTGSNSLDCEGISFVPISTSVEEEVDTTLNGKLKRHRPDFFSSLSVWEKETLENYVWLRSTTIGVVRPVSEEGNKLVDPVLNIESPTRSN